jgi:hypothetical protein
LIEIAWDSLGNSLVWDADPYLPSGIILASAKNEGLFIYQATYAPAARIKGQVTDATTGFPLADAKIFVLNTPNADTTGATGAYKTGAPGSGNYALRVERSGYQTQIVTNVALLSGTIITRNFALTPLLISTESVDNASYVRILPSPFKDFLSVEFPAESPYKTGNTTLRLIDFTGKTILVKKADPSGNTQLNGLNVLPIGVYLLEITAETGLNHVFQVIKC